MTTAIATNVADRVRSAFNFNVTKLPLRGPDGLTTPVYGLFRSDSGDFVGRGSVTNRYEPHSVDDVLALVESAGAAFGGVADVRCHFDDGHFVSVQPTREHRLEVYGRADGVFPRIIIDAPYGGTGSFRGSLGLFRDMCRNLMRLQMAQGTTVAIRHTSGLRLQMDELIATFATLEKSWSNLSAVVLGMEQRRVRMVEFLDAIYGRPEQDATGRAVTMHRNRTEMIFRRLQRERVASGRPTIGNDFVVTGWEAYNAVQGYTQHDAIRRGRPDEMSRAVMALASQSVSRAERLIYEMAI